MTVAGEQTRGQGVGGGAEQPRSQLRARIETPMPGEDRTTPDGSASRSRLVLIDPLAAPEPEPELPGGGDGPPPESGRPDSARRADRVGTRRLLLVVVGGLALAAVSVTWVGVPDRPGLGAAVAPQAAPYPLPVPTFDVGELPFQPVRTFAGRVEPERTVDIAFQVSGQIVDLPLEEGARVSAGTVIARLDPADHRLAMARTEAMRALAHAEHERVQELVGRSIAPQAQLDRARAEFAQAEVAVDQARRALDQTQITAPFDALVARRMAEVWSNVTPAQPVLRLQDVTRFLVEISLPEELAARARMDPDAFEAVARFPALPGLELPLAPERFVTEADPVAQTYTVKLSLQGDDPRILPGMTVSVEVREQASQSGVLVPVSAIDTNAAQVPQVWVVAADGTVMARKVVLGMTQGDQVLVTEGIEAGARIVAAGWWRLDEGARVRPAGP